MRRRSVLRAIITLSFVIPIALVSHSRFASGLAAGVTPRGYGPGYGATQTLTPQQAQILAQGSQQKMIVILANQHSNLGGRSNTGPRTSAISADQAGILSQLSQVHATSVHSFHLINAISATITSSEADNLRANPAVQSVVPDRPLRMVKPVAQLVKGQSAIHQRDVGTLCAANAANPALEPEALAETNATQAHNLGVDGSGVKVAIIADGINPQNPDLLRGGNPATPVISNYVDFGGSGTASPTNGIEAFIDAGSVAAQGNQVYDWSRDLGAPFDCYIRIQGVAPGASIIFVKTADINGLSLTSADLEGVEYAVANGANVISESFGSNPYPDANDDPITLADDAAVALGVTVTASVGDAGPMGTVGSPSTSPIPGVIEAGASTTFRVYAQFGMAGIQLGSGGWLDDNISGLSSGGTSQTGQKTVSVVAPGDLNFILCDPNFDTFAGCGGLSFNVSGGTSESAPLTAGLAALVIEAYRNTHGGATPSPALVQQIIQSTATDLGIPSSQQGSGLINCLRAIKAAMSISDGNGSPPPQGSSLILSPSSITASTQPFTSLSESFQVTNTGTSAVVVKPQARQLSTAWHQSYAPFLDANSPNFFVDDLGVERPFVAQTFTVPLGTQRLDANIAWNNSAKPDTLVRVDLFDPQGNFANWSEPQTSTPLGYQPTQAFGHADVRDPAPGTWTAVIWGHRPANGFSGNVSLDITGSRYTTWNATPAFQTVAPGATASFHVNITSAATPGDLSAEIAMNPDGNAASTLGGAIPIAIRSLIPTSTQHSSGFHGVLTGGNGRFGAPGQELTYQLDVPAGQRDLDLGITLNDPGYNLEGVLSDPSGNPLDVQSTITAFQPGLFAPAATTNKLQFFWANPTPGRWSFLLLINNNISGKQTSEPFTGTVSFNGVKVNAPTVPNSASTRFAAGVPETYPITVTNTGNTTEEYFVDPRLNQLANLTSSFSQDLPFPDPDPLAIYPPWPPFVVPPKSTSYLTVTEDSTGSSPSTVPVIEDVAPFSGAPTEGITGAPDIEGTPFVDLGNGHDGVSTVENAAELPMGPYWNNPVEIGPFTTAGAIAAHSVTLSQVTTQAFDANVTSDTGDAWLTLTQGSPATFTPLILAPGQTGTIHVTITPSGNSGTQVSGQLNVETLAVDANNPGNPLFAITSVSDEVAPVPYNYTIK